MIPAESRFSKVSCLDSKCKTVLYVLPGEKTVECYQCGQKHNRNSLTKGIEVTRSEDISIAVQHYMCRTIIHGNRTPKRGTEMVKVLGLSNYHCKLLSPLLTRYGMDKNTSRAKLLTEMNQGETLDCSLFGDRVFLIEPQHISIHGFGKDITGSLDYLSETLKLINSYNDGEERLIPIHADGDGHCLVHAISRALVGRELFWHPLRCSLKKHFETNLEGYKELFKDFIDTDEWKSIIEECDPDFQPPEGELHGLRNIHIFGLANVLRRPIILLDSLECMQKCGDYSALFLPGFVEPDLCRGKDNTLNKPLCIAWSSYSHNHYIPLVGIQKKPLPSLPRTLIPKVWGMPQNKISSYIEFDEHGGCIIGGNRTLSEEYKQLLVHAIEAVYIEKNGIHPLLVADAKLYLYPDNVLFSAKPAMVLEKAKAAVREGRLYRCLLCGALYQLGRVEEKWSNSIAMCSEFLQNSAKNQDSTLSSQDCILISDALKGDIFINFHQESPTCNFCNSTNLRKITSDGTMICTAEDKTKFKRSISMYEESKRYYPDEGISQKSNKEAKPARILLELLWEGKKIEHEISYLDLQDDSKTNLNQFVKDLSKKLIEMHFSDKSTDVNLQAYIAEEICKTVQKHSVKNSSDLSSEPEIKREDSNKTMKLENFPSYHTKPAEIQYIKVCTPDGLHANLSLTEDGISYGQLQEWIKNEFNIPIKNQVIKKGVPPRLIKTSGDSNKQMLTDLKHGDRLLVENQRRDDTPYSLSPSTVPRNVLKDCNAVKTAIKSLNKTILWSTMKKSPQNFKRNGSIYNMIAGNRILTNSMHTKLEDYPGKVFYYNSVSDSIELCVKPFGHFTVSEDIEDRIQSVKHGFHASGFTKCPLCDDLPLQYKTSPSCTFLRKPDNMDIL